MKRLMFVCSLLCTPVPACATTGTTGTIDHPASERAYVVARQQFAERQYPKSIALLRHAASTLPSTASYDQARHELVMRIAYVQIYAYEKTGDLGYLRDAELMLERYIERPESRRTADNHRQTLAMTSTVRGRLNEATLRGAIARSKPHERYPSDAAVQALLAPRSVNFPRSSGSYRGRRSASQIGTPPVGRYGRQMMPSYSASDNFRAALMDPR